MASCFLKRGNQFKVSSRDAMDLHEKLPVGNYVVKRDTFSGEFFLEQIDSFALPSKIYGGCDNDARRIFKTFESREGTTGVVLCGEKGSGKTMTAKLVCSMAAEEGMPTIVIDSPYYGETFNAFLQMIDQRCIVLFDEFEKLYDSEDQEEILTLLDGVFNSTKLFIFTCNNTWGIDSHMKNRPGRVFYLIEFGGITEDFIREYCAEHLNDKLQVNAICCLSLFFFQFNFDMLQAICEELNRYGSTLGDALRMLNVKPDLEGDSVYRVGLSIGGRDIPKEDVNEWSGNPLNGEIEISYKDGDTSRSVAFTPNDVKKVETHERAIIVENSDGAVASLVRKNKIFRSFRHLL